VKKLFTVITIAAMILPTTLYAWESKLVQVDAQGRITYNKDSDGFVIPDFSHAGYKNGNEDIPNYQPSADRIKTVNPLADANANNATNIQNAINEVAKLTPDANGFRGVVQLSAGRYNVDGQINLNASGVVLRGAGRGPDKATDQLSSADLQNMTMIYRRGTSNAANGMNVIVMGPANAGTPSWDNGTNKTDITTTKVMPGDFSFQVQSTSGYAVGDAVVIKYPTTEAFLEAIWYGGNSNWVNGNNAASKWASNSVNISFHRYIKKIEGNTVTVDAPIFYCLDKKYSQAFMHKVTKTTNTNIAVENLRISMDRTPASNTAAPADHNCIKMNALENCWTKGLHLSDFVHAGIKTEGTTRTTILDCRAVDCSGYYSGGSQYNFENYSRSQQILFKNCLSRNGRHHWISNGGSTVSGIVVLNHTSTLANAAAEGHRYFSQGILMDGWKEANWTFTNNAHRIGYFLRDNMGTNHGWGAIFSVLWNCDIQNGSVYLDKIPTGQNYSIGSTANTVRKYRNSDAKYTMGYVEGTKQAGLTPVSLYEAQLKARKLGDPSVAVTGITLNKNATTLSVGEEETLTANVLPANASNKNINWTSSDNTKVSVAGGKITAVAAGTVTITATTADGGKKATCQVTVAAVAVTGVKLNKSSIAIMEGSKETLIATVAPTNAANKTVNWTSSAPLIATVTNGVITAIATGSATITATTADGNKPATCQVSVSPAISGKAIRAIYVSSGGTVPANTPNQTVKYGGSSIANDVLVKSNDGGIYYVQSEYTPNNSWFSININVPVNGNYKIEFIFKTGTARGTVQAYIGANPDGAVDVAVSEGNKVGNPLNMRVVDTDNAVNVSTAIGAGGTNKDALYYKTVLADSKALTMGVNTFKTVVVANGAKWAHLPIQAIITPLFGFDGGDEGGICDGCGDGTGGEEDDDDEEYDPDLEYDPDNPGDTPIREYKDRSNKYGIIVDNNPITTDFAEIFVRTPEKSDVKIIIYDNSGNVMFEGLGDFLPWDLKNKNGRKVASGSYLIVVEATGASGKIYKYSAKLGVKR
jgi:hypothetical protein